MKRQVTASPGAELTSSVFNAVQDNAMGMALANQNNDFGSSQPIGTDGLLWQANASVLADTLIVIDANDWHDRTVWGSCFQHRTVTDIAGGSTDYNYDGVVDTTYFLFEGYLGKGAYSSVAGAGTLVSNGNPPTRAAGGTVTSWFVNLASAANALALYVDPSSLKLCLYNHTGFTIKPTIRIHFTAATGKRP